MNRLGWEKVSGTFSGAGSEGLAVIASRRVILAVLLAALAVSALPK